MQAGRSLALLIVLGVAGCAGQRGIRGDDAPTLKSLASRHVVVEPDAGIDAGPDQAIAAYSEFLKAAAPRARERTEAMRRLGDLEMDSADRRSESATGTGAPDYRAAIARYQQHLAAAPQDPGNDRVLYQLARAQEQGGDLDAALKTLDRLVGDHPATGLRDEAQFRRGELLFTARDYARAEQAYASVLAGAAGAQGHYHERALYMHGWSVFKQGRLEEALHSFFGVLDRKLAVPEIAGDGDAEHDTIAALSRADRELVEDTFRVTSLCLENLQGADSIPPYMTSDARRSYEFRVYQQLGEIYLKQERTKDAADTFGAFARRRPLHAQAPLLQARVIDIYQQAGFANQAFAAKKEYVERYGRASDFRRANPSGWARAQPLRKQHLVELARTHHAAAQQGKRSADVQEAVRWYREAIASFPTDPDTPNSNFLLAELLVDDGRLQDAAAEFEKTAYAYPAHAQSADAGYAALLAYAGQAKTSGAADAPALQAAGVESALRFAAAFPGDARTGAVLADAAERLYALHDNARASSIARQVLQLAPPAAPAQRRVAWTVIAHTAFEGGDFAHAEQAYGEVLALVPAQDAARGDLVERLAASVYKQGEAARSAGQARVAVAHFERVAAVAPQSGVRAAAQVDAAAALIGLKDWAGAARLLEDFRQRYPRHALQGEVTTQLAAVYLEQQQWARAAAEFDRVSASATDPLLARDAAWQAAELYDKADAKTEAAAAYERYLKRHAEPFERAVEARWRLAAIAHAQGQAARELAWMREVLQADQRGGEARTARTRTLAARAALALAEPLAGAYRQVALVEPLARQLKLKKSRMEEALKAYAVATDYGVADVTTAATHHVAALYQDFGRALIDSQRPKKLSTLEREQYTVMLEEQAFPFEEKAIELHEVNARRASDGLYDEWVQASFRALATLRPVRYGKTERSESELTGADAQAGLAHRLAGRFADAVKALDAAAHEAPPRAAVFNQLGIAYRQQGDFARAREAYERAIAIDAVYAAPVLNLGILNDLYLGDGMRALSLYGRYLAMSAAGDAAVTKWVADLQNRKPALQRHALQDRKEQP